MRARTSVLLVCMSLLTACATPRLLYQAPEPVAQAASLSAQRFHSGGFELATWSRINSLTAPLHIYIEGDGRAWRSRQQLSSDPTPRDPLALRLAAADPAANILYLGRPCQFGTVTAPECEPRYWSSHRYSEEVVASLDLAIDAFIREQQLPEANLVLIGYSGGGAIAALLAARRDDVSQLLTVAGNLDHQTWTRLHQVSPLTGSLNPVDFAAALAGTQQVHFAGEDDDIVPVQVLNAYRDALPEQSLTRIIPVAGADHDCCWVELWPDLLRQRYPAR